MKRRHDPVVLDDVIDELALVEVEHAGGALGSQRVVRDHHDGLLKFPVELFHQVQDLAGGHAVEVSGRLVGDQQVGVGYDRPLAIAAQLVPGLPEKLTRMSECSRPSRPTIRSVCQS